MTASWSGEGASIGMPLAALIGICDAFALLPLSEND